MTKLPETMGELATFLYGAQAPKTVPSAQVDFVERTGPVVRVWIGTDVHTDEAEEVALDLAKAELGTEALGAVARTIDGYEVVFESADL